jgi:prepilin-type N-terminal cleavage/methylation domain-containing protein
VTLKNKGFTLIEVLICLVIIAMLMVVMVPSFRGLQKETWQTKSSGDLKTIQTALEAYYKNNGHYPWTGAYQSTLTAAVPQILPDYLYDPFAPNEQTPYRYSLSRWDAMRARYYIVYTYDIGYQGGGGCWPEQGAGSASVDENGIVTINGDVIWVSNGHLP